MRRHIFTLLCMMISFLCVVNCLPVSAAGECTVTAASAKVNAGEQVYIPISIDNNPGISAVTLTITYNSDVLTFQKYIKGGAFTDNLMLKDHPDKNQIKIALVESSKDSTNNDDILTLQFSVKENAQTGFYKIDIEYGKGDFANREMEPIMPKIISGGVEVVYNSQAGNCAHKNYSEWKTVVKPTCTGKGIEERACTVCGHKETRETAPAGHEYEEEWTIDTPATADRDGVMTRHCKHCTATTDRITFKYEDSEKENFNNSFGAEVPKDNYTEGLFHMQHPDEELTGAKPSENSSAGSDSGSFNSESSKQTDSVVSESGKNSATDSENSVTESGSSDLSHVVNQNNKKNLLTIFSAAALVALIVVIIAVSLIKPKDKSNDMPQ